MSNLFIMFISAQMSVAICFFIEAIHNGNKWNTPLRIMGTMLILLTIGIVATV